LVTIKQKNNSNFAGQIVPTSDFKRGVSAYKKAIVTWLATNVLVLVFFLAINDRDRVPVIISGIVVVNIAIIFPFIMFNLLDEVIDKKIAHPIVISIILIAYVANRGIANAVYDIDNDNDPYAAIYQIRLLKEDQKTLIPLMNIDKGLIYKAKGDIHFAKWADIS
jgi:hypothetical protein